jgi:adenine/guanine phosphoribosyltransferase-like PRPP-binding protein
VIGGAETYHKAVARIPRGKPRGQLHYISNNHFMGEFTLPEIPHEEKKEVIEYPEVAELEQPIKRIFDQLRERINSRTYPLLIGLDASGRIPALIIHEALGQVYGRKGFTKPEIFFCAGFRAASSEEVKIKKGAELKEKITKFIQQRNVGLEKGKRVLIVEDAIGKGGSTSPIIQVLNEMGYAVDVAAMGYIESADQIRVEGKGKKSGVVLDVKVAIGQKGNPRIYDTPCLAGVMKHPGSVFSTGFGMAVKRKALELENTKKKTKKQRETLREMKWLAGGNFNAYFKRIHKEGVNKARKDAHLVANNVAKDFLEKNK